MFQAANDVEKIQRCFSFLDRYARNLLKSASDRPRGWKAISFRNNIFHTNVVSVKVTKYFQSITIIFARHFFYHQFVRKSCIPCDTKKLYRDTGACLASKAIVIHRLKSRKRKLTLIMIWKAGLNRCVLDPSFSASAGHVNHLNAVLRQPSSKLK